MEIIAQLARERTVEGMVLNVAKTDRLSDDLRDLCQMVYLVLLEYDDEKIVDLWTSGAIRFFIARIIINQYQSKTSQFYRIIRRFQQTTEDIGPNQENIPDA